MKRFTKKYSLACFSPPVMIATFFIEVGLIIYSILTRKLNLAVSLAILLLAILATFQLAEYGVCENLGFSNSIWSKLGFSAITLLPALGIHLILAIADKKNKLIYLAYGTAVLWIVLFLFGNIMAGAVCKGNYVIFDFTSPFEGYYYIYYDLFLIVGIASGIWLAYKAKKARIKAALIWLVAGYMSFVLPAMIFTKITNNHELNSPLPSVLCGFAIILALVISFKVLPNSSSKK